MKVFSLRTTLALSALTAFAVIAGMIKDYSENNPERFMQDKEISFVKRLDFTMKREVASNIKEQAKDKNKMALEWLPVNTENAEIINGAWKIYKRTDELDQVSDLNKDVRLELIGNAKVIINNNQKIQYRVSKLTEDLGIYYMALINVNNKGIEILELTKIQSKKIEIKLTDVKSGELSEAEVSDEAKSKFPDMELVLDKALNPDKSKDVMSEDQIEGHLSLRNGNLEQLSVILNKGTDKAEILEFDLAKINDGGQFEADLGDELVTGMISYNGDNALRVRIITGKLAGTMLNFLTAEQKDLNIEQLNESEKTYEQEVAIEAQNNLEAERKEAAHETDREIEAAKSAQEAQVKKSGFEF